jgi:pilus assembly protein Flp/PilA
MIFGGRSTARNRSRGIHFSGRHHDFMQDELRATAIEYGLIAALISVVIIGSITAVGTQFTTTFTAVSNALSGPTIEDGVCPRRRSAGPNLLRFRLIERQEFAR